MQALRKFGLMAGFGALALYAALTWMGPRGISALRKQYDDIRTLQADVDGLKQEIKERQERNQRLRDNPAEQEMEIRGRLKLLRKGEKKFILPQSARSEDKKD